MEGIIGIIGLLLVILVPLTGFSYRRYRQLKGYYEIIARKSSTLKPRDILKERPFEEYYYRREADNLISGCLSRKESVLLIGPPLSGKSRAAYQALIDLDKPHDVVVPRCRDIDLETFIFPTVARFWRQRIILFDDLQRFVEQRNFEHLFREAIQNNLVILATCRSGMEHIKAKKRMLDKNIDLETVFGKNIIELGRISETVGKEIADEVGKSWDAIQFDGTVGSIFMPLGEMKKRFIECNEIEKTILRAISTLYACGVYQENMAFPVNWVRTLAKKEGLEGRDFEWTGWLRALRDKEFVSVGRGKIQAEETYLEHVIEPRTGVADLSTLEEMIAAFSAVPEALFRLGNRAYEIGTIELEKAEYMRTAISAYEKALKVYTKEGFPDIHWLVRRNLGAVLRLYRGE